MLAISINHYREIDRVRKSTLKLNAYIRELILPNIKEVVRENKEKVEDAYSLLMQ